MHPVLFTIGSFPVRAYGVLLVLGFFAGLWRAVRLCRRRMRVEPPGSPRRIHPDVIFDLGTMGLLVGIVGARLLFVLLDWSSFAQRPIEALEVWQGGLSLHGGLLFGILFLAWYSRRRRLSLMALGDVCAPSFALAYAIGRIGCLLNGCCYGAPSSLPWAVRFPDESHPGLLTPPSHPTQLYATLFNLGFFWILTRWEKRPRVDGELFYAYIGMYGVYRFIDEIFRAGATSTYLTAGAPFTAAQLASILMVAVGVSGVLWLRRHRKPAPVAAADTAVAAVPLGAQR